MAESKISYAKLGFWALAATIVSGTVFYFMRQAELLKKTCFNFKSAQVIKIGLLSTVVKVDLEIKNKSEIPIEVTGLDLDVAINGMQVSKIKNAYSKTLAANSSTIFPVVVEFSPKNIAKSVKDSVKAAANIQSILAMATSPQSVIFSFKGTMSVKSAYIVVSSLPIETSATLKELRTPSKETC